MKAIIYGKGKDIEKQYAKCITYAMMEGYDVAETTSTIPLTIQRLAKRDIDAVMVSSKDIIADSSNDYEIVASTFSRYRAKIIIIE